MLVYVIRKLPHYFQAHMVYVLTEYPLRSLLKRFDFTAKKLNGEPDSGRSIYSTSLEVRSKAKCLLTLLRNSLTAKEVLGWCAVWKLDHGRCL